MTSWRISIKRLPPPIGSSPHMLHAAAGQVLFPPVAERERRDAWLTGELARAAERVAAGPVTPTFDLGRFREELAQFDFGAPRPLEELLHWVVARMERGL